jgi:hypothetical protein
MLLLYILTVACIGLLVGTEFSVSVFVNPVLGKLDDEAQARTIRLFAVRLGTAMPFWYIASLVLLLIETFVQRHEAGIPLLIAASAVWSAVIVLTLMFLVPINNRMMRLEGSFSEEERRNHKRWDRLHRWRVVALTACLLLLIVGSGSAR